MFFSFEIVHLMMRVLSPCSYNCIRRVMRVAQASESNTTVHVGNLIGTETEENMRNAFKEFGTIDNIRVPGKNFGFVAFTTHLAVCASNAHDQN